MENYNDGLDISTQEQEQDEAETSTESIEELKAKLEKAEELAHNYKIRAEKVEAKLKAPTETKTPKKESSEFSQSDLYALIKNDVAEEDIPEVADYAKLKGITVSEALKSTMVKTLLRTKSEERLSAEASNTGPAKRGSTKNSEDTLLSKAKNGELPNSDEDIMRLVIARRKQ